MLLNTASPVPIPNTPSSLLPYVKPSPADRFDDSGPYKADMMARMEQLNRGDRVQPPCDRCRRLHMDCLKNLTACQGCTKKHAKCSWKDVEEQELKDHPFVLRVRSAEEIAEQERSEGEGSKSGNDVLKTTPKKELQEVRDEELLGEDSGDEDAATAKIEEKPIVQNHSPNYPAELTFKGLEPDKVDEIPATLSPMSRSLGTTTSKFDIIRDTNPSEPIYSRKESAPQTPTTTYQIPQAQMTRLPSLERTGPTASERFNGNSNHTRTEYEKDIYSQLNEATREQSSQLPPTSTYPFLGNTASRSSGHSPHREDPVRVFTAGVGSEPTLSSDSPAQAPPQSEPSLRKENTSPPKPLIKEFDKPQMPSPPLSSVPAQEQGGEHTPSVDMGIHNGGNNGNGNGNGSHTLAPGSGQAVQTY